MSIVLINKIHFENYIIHSSCDKPPAVVLDPYVGHSRSDIADILLFSDQSSSCSNESHIIAWPGDFVNGQGRKTVTVFYIFTIVRKRDGTYSISQSVSGHCREDEPNERISPFAETRRLQMNTDRSNVTNFWCLPTNRGVNTVRR